MRRRASADPTPFDRSSRGAHRGRAGGSLVILRRDVAQPKNKNKKAPAQRRGFRLLSLGEGGMGGTTAGHPTNPASPRRFQPNAGDSRIFVGSAGTRCARRCAAAAICCSRNQSAFSCLTTGGAVRAAALVFLVICEEKQVSEKFLTAQLFSEASTSRPCGGKRRIRRAVIRRPTHETEFRVPTRGGRRLPHGSLGGSGRSTGTGRG